MFVKRTREKFNPDKSYKHFPGNSIIQPFKEGKLVELIIAIKKEMEKSNLFDKFVFLPAGSYHMTVCDIVTYQNIDSDPNLVDFKFKNETDIQLIDQLIINELGSEIFDLNVTMKPVEINYKQILLEPSTEEGKLKLQKFREEVLKKLGIKINTNYRFHISLTYKLMELTEEEKIEIANFLQSLNQKYLAILPEIKVNNATLVAFNDMSEFRILSKGRQKLGQL